MADLIERLTTPRRQLHRFGKMVDKSPPAVQREAAAEIEALRTALSQEREAREKAERERDEARGIVRDVHWMAVRYADNRKSYAVGMCNDALRKAYDAGWLKYTRDNGKLDPQYARDGMFGAEWVDAVTRANARSDALEASLAKAKRLLKPFADYANLPSFDRLPADMPLTPGSGMAAKQVTVGEFRGAARFLSQEPNQ
jgi:hypothetical protein